jgi:hypothetical protein
MGLDAERFVYGKHLEEKWKVGSKPMGYRF